MSTEKWQKENTLIFSIRLQNSSGIPDALAEVIKDGKCTRNAYVIDSIREKLIRDGYDPEKYKPRKEE